MDGTDTNLVCSCPQAGFCARRNTTIPSVHWRRCQNGEVEILDRLYESLANAPDAKKQWVPNPTVLESRKKQSAATVRVTQPNVSNVGDRILKAFENAMGTKIACQTCLAYLSKLNKIKEGAHNHDELLRDLRADMPIAMHIRKEYKHGALVQWMSHVLASVVPRAQSLIRCAVSGRTPEQVRAESIDRGDDALRHLTFHIYATKHHDCWQWNLQELSKRWHLFNGIKVIGIVEGPRIHKPDAILEFAKSLGMVFDQAVVDENRRALREVVTWLPMLDKLKIADAAENEYVFSCHAKGVRHDTREPQIIAWADLMYQACLDDWDLVQEQLRTYVLTGAFKKYGDFQTPGNHAWHYSGTFYWWRPAIIAQRNWRRVDLKFFGTESWPGLMAPSSEAGCLFSDHTGHLYSQETWDNQIWPAWKQRQQGVGV